MPARNLGESQARSVLKVGKTSFGNFSTQKEMSARPINTSVNLGERSLDSFPKRKTMQDFHGSTAKNYGKKGMTYGG